jgi:hypothetical protein
VPKIQERPKIQCRHQGCSKFFLTSAEHNRHAQAEHRDAAGKLACPLCKQFKRHDKMQEHLNECFEKRKRLVQERGQQQRVTAMCVLCRQNVDLRTEGNWDQHIVECAKKYPQCNKCSANFFISSQPDMCVFRCGHVFCKACVHGHLADYFERASEGSVHKDFVCMKSSCSKKIELLGTLQEFYEQNKVYFT